jgi:hypothetical protein
MGKSAFQRIHRQAERMRAAGNSISLLETAFQRREVNTASAQKQCRVVRRRSFDIDFASDRLHIGGRVTRDVSLL